MSKLYGNKWTELNENFKGCALLALNSGYGHIAYLLDGKKLDKLATYWQPLTRDPNIFNFRYIVDGNGNIQLEKWNPPVIPNKIEQGHFAVKLLEVVGEQYAESLNNLDWNGFLKQFKL